MTDIKTSGIRNLRNQIEEFLIQTSQQQGNILKLCLRKVL